jgi:hypothetical protein
MKKFLYIFILLFIVGWAQAQQRVVYTINDGWKFTKGSPFEAQLAGCDDSSWETVNIPHTWNNKDADDETPGFYRGPAWYRKQLFVDKSQEGRQAVIYFEGANQEVRFYLNGQFVGEHKGGYTRFCFDITSHLRYGQENLFAIYVNNVYNPNIPPLSELGLNNQITTELDYAKTRNQGIIFIVGPTGSGKSTTIYSALSSLNAIKKNIISFEDPVEMRQLYWSQGQRNVVKDNENMNFDYLQSKKSILRQDPDIILMGEVRDEDSASFAIEAANTGHLVFTTLHSNSAAAAFERIKKLYFIDHLPKTALGKLKKNNFQLVSVKEFILQIRKYLNEKQY